MLGVNTNLMSLNASFNLENTQSSMATSIQRLSTGLRINSAADDAAGLAISQRMTAQINGMNTAMTNTNDAISMSQTADGALGQVSDSLQRMRELAVESANATNGSGDRANLNAEYSQLQSEITRVIGTTAFNGIDILSTSGAGTQSFQVGANSQDQISVTTTALDTDTTMLAVTQSTQSDILTQSDATTALSAIDTALDTVNQARANYGAYENRFSSVLQTLQTSVTNQTNARSQILDTDYAAETTNLSRSQILQQAGTAMLSQANQAPQSVLSLLK